MVAVVVAVVVWRQQQQWWRRFAAVAVAVAVAEVVEVAAVAAVAAVAVVEAVDNRDRIQWRMVVVVSPGHVRKFPCLIASIHVSLTGNPAAAWRYLIDCWIEGRL